LEPAVATAVATPQTLSFDVTQDVQAWMTDPASNRGWALKMQNEPWGQTLNLHSRETRAHFINGRS